MGWPSAALRRWRPGDGGVDQPFASRDDRAPCEAAISPRLAEVAVREAQRRRAAGHRRRGWRGCRRDARSRDRAGPPSRPGASPARAPRPGSRRAARPLSRRCGPARARFRRTARTAPPALRRARAGRTARGAHSSDQPLIPSGPARRRASGWSVDMASGTIRTSPAVTLITGLSSHRGVERALSAWSGPAQPSSGRAAGEGGTWSEWQDSNLRPPPPEDGALPG